MSPKTFASPTVHAFVFWIVISCTAVCTLQAADVSPPVQTDVFVSGADGVHTYRIPGMIVSPKGTLLAFCEARKLRVSECQVAELADGRLMLNMRENTGQSCRAVATSDDGGQTWSEPHWDRALNECPCQASFIRYSEAAADERSRLLFANPDVAGERYGVVKRTKMTVRLSYDEGKTWPVKKMVHAGPSSYSSLVRLPDGDLGLAYEGGQQHRREWIRFARFSLAWLTDGSDGSTR